MVSQQKLTPNEIRFLHEALSANYVNGNIRLREGEYQYELAKAIASFQLELCFPDVKDLIKRLYGEEKIGDIQFVRKIQTILKKMEKSNIVRILPKNKPWELQRYTLSSFRFRDSDKNLVVLATDDQMRQMQNLLYFTLNQSGLPLPTTQPVNARIKVLILAFIIIASYTTIVWDFMQSLISPIIFISAFSIAVACSVMLGKILSRE